MNEALFRAFNGLAGKSIFFDTFFIFGAQFLIFFLVVGGIFFLMKDKRNMCEKIFVIVGSIMVAWVISELINSFFPVVRPYLALQNVYSLFEHGSNDSFPSGHATAAFALAFASFFYNKHVAVYLLLGAFLVGFSRVVAGVHFPLDIVGALVLALVVAVLIKYAYKRIQQFWADFSNLAKE